MQINNWEFPRKEFGMNSSHREISMSNVHNVITLSSDRGTRKGLWLGAVLSLYGINMKVLSENPDAFQMLLNELSWKNAQVLQRWMDMYVDEQFDILQKDSSS